MLSRLRPRATSGLAPTEAELLAPVTPFGRVTGIVFFDPVYGAHVKVQLYEYQGAPPTPVAMTVPEVRVSPSPNLTLFAYLVGDWVEIRTMLGAQAAMKMR